MAWYNILKNASAAKLAGEQTRQIEGLQAEIADIRLAIGNVTKTPAEMGAIIKSSPRTLSKPLHYKTNTVSAFTTGRKDINNTFYGPQYDLGEIARALDVEPYIAQSVRKHREQILKEGYIFTGTEDEMVDYIKNRFYEMELVSGVSFSSTLREFTTNLVAYGTAFLVLKRDITRSSGRRTKIYGKKLEPIAAIYPMDPTSVTVNQNKHGHPVRWKQSITNALGNTDTVTFEDSEVIIATMDKKSGFIFGTPYILPTLDDVRSLRRLEEITEIIMHNHAFGLIHWKVGSDEYPVQIDDNGVSEIDYVKQVLTNIPSEGGIVTTHRVEATILDAEKTVMDTSKALEYFEKRVLGGLRLSEVDLGRGEISKASAATVSQGLQDSAKDFQAVIEDCLNTQLLTPLLHEGGFNINVENKVVISFSMINREEERARQQHGQDLYLGNTITCEEYRKEYLGKKCMTEEQVNNETNAGIEHKRNVELQRMANAAKAAAKTSSSSTKIKNKTQNKTRPANQSGKKTTKTRVTANNNLTDTIYRNNAVDNLYALKDTIEDFVNRHGTGKAASNDFLDMTTKEEELLSLLRAYDVNSTIDARKVLEPIIENGIEDCISDMAIVGTYRIPKKLVDRFFKNFVSKSYQKIGDICRDLLNNNDVLAGIDISISPSVAVESIFDQLHKEVEQLSPKHIDIAYRFGYTRAAKNHGYKTIIFDPVDGCVCDDCENDGEIEISIASKEIPLTTILNTHSNCLFDITLGNK